jgi:hypothetical protein
VVRVAARLFRRGRVNVDEDEEAAMRRRVRRGLAGVLSAKRLLSFLNYRSAGSMSSVGSIMSLKSVGSILSIGSAG